jgi:hypothetical protein
LLHLWAHLRAEFIQELILIPPAFGEALLLLGAIDEVETGGLSEAFESFAKSLQLAAIDRYFADLSMVDFIETPLGLGGPNGIAALLVTLPKLKRRLLQFGASWIWLHSQWGIDLRQAGIRLR